jgi:Protein of unknown function (DUF2798)
MTAGNRQSLIMILLMTVMIGLAISAWMTYQATGMNASFLSAWLQRFLSTYIIVLPTVLVVSPFAQWLAKKIDSSFDAKDDVTNPRLIALEAWDKNARGHRGEGFQGWYEMLSSSVSITMPLGPFRGESKGIATARQIYESIAGASPRLVYEKPLRVSQGDNTVVIEFDDHGTIAGYPYRNRIAASFDIKDGKVAAYREYFGDIDPAVVAMMNSAPASTVNTPPHS